MHRYIISDAAKLLDVEAHVLRNWEDELSLNIPRNEIGHRIYTDDNILELQMIKKLKYQGFSLKHIKLLIPYFNKLSNMSSGDIAQLQNMLSKNSSNITHDTYSDKHIQFKNILYDTLTSFFNDYLNYISQELIYRTTDEINKQLSFHLSSQQAYIQEHYTNLEHMIQTKATYTPKETITKANKTAKVSIFTPKKKKNIKISPA